MNIGWLVIGVIAAALYGVLVYREDGCISGQSFLVILALAGLGLFSAVFLFLSWLLYSRVWE